MRIYSAGNRCARAHEQEIIVKVLPQTKLKRLIIRAVIITAILY